MKTKGLFHAKVSESEDLAGPDYDFGAGPNLFSVTIDGKRQDVIGAGQKSGVYWALNPDNGEILWNTLVGPGGTLGGIEWGTAVDGERIYAAVANTNQIPHELISGEVTTGGSWSALDPDTGEILRQTADPLKNLLTGPLSVANGVVYGGSMDPEGHMYALNAETGKILWSYKSGGSVNSAPSIVDGSLYWGSGYSRFNLGTANNKLFAFSLSNKKK
jgi:polyvinyl alcohol dehydrogenase (cytochrome)